MNSSVGLTRMEKDEDGRSWSLKGEEDRDRQHRQRRRLQPLDLRLSTTVTLFCVSFWVICVCHIPLAQSMVCYPEVDFIPEYNPISVDDYWVNCTDPNTNCEINCNDVTDCTSKIVQCPSNADCKITCEENNCVNVEINCPMSGNCAISAIENYALTGEIRCRDSTICQLQCNSTDGYACHDGENNLKMLCENSKSCLTLCTAPDNCLWVDVYGFGNNGTYQQRLVVDCEGEACGYTAVYCKNAVHCILAENESPYLYFYVEPASNPPPPQIIQYNSDTGYLICNYSPDIEDICGNIDSGSTSCSSFSSYHPCNQSSEQGCHTPISSSPSSSASPSSSVSLSSTASQSLSASPSTSISISSSPTQSLTASTSSTPSTSISISSSPTQSLSASLSPSTSISITPTYTSSASISTSFSPTQSLSALSTSSSPTISLSPTQSSSVSISPISFSPTQSLVSSLTSSVSPSLASISASQTPAPVNQTPASTGNTISRSNSKPASSATANNNDRDKTKKPNHTNHAPSSSEPSCELPDCELEEKSVYFNEYRASQRTVVDITDDSNTTFITLVFPPDSVPVGCNLSVSNVFEVNTRYHREDRDNLYVSFVAPKVNIELVGCPGRDKLKKEITIKILGLTLDKNICVGYAQTSSSEWRCLNGELEMERQGNRTWYIATTDHFTTFSAFFQFTNEGFPYWILALSFLAFCATVVAIVMIAFEKSSGLRAAVAGFDEKRALREIMKQVERKSTMNPM